MTAIELPELSNDLTNDRMDRIDVRSQRVVPSGCMRAPGGEAETSTSVSLILSDGAAGSTR
jgi:hypothetical protein